MTKRELKNIFIILVALVLFLGCKASSDIAQQEKQKQKAASWLEKRLNKNYTKKNEYDSWDGFVINDTFVKYSYSMPPYWQTTNTFYTACLAKNDHDLYFYKKKIDAKTRFTRSEMFLNFDRTVTRKSFLIDLPPDCVGFDKTIFYNRNDTTQNSINRIKEDQLEGFFFYTRNKIQANRIKKKINFLASFSESESTTISSSDIIVTFETPETIFVKGGTFKIGDSEHTVTLDDYEIGKYEITVGEYRAFCEATNRDMPELHNNTTDRHPMNNVTWQDAVDYCRWLSDRTGDSWRLPTEAEWEFAARGGTLSRNYKYSGSNYLGQVAAFNENSLRVEYDDEIKYITTYSDIPPTLPVGSLHPNELGIYDMSGNVREWCNDWFDANYYKRAPEKNPQGSEEGTRKVVRGGGFTDAFETDIWCQVGMRYHAEPDHNNEKTGFRVVK